MLTFCGLFFRFGGFGLATAGTLLIVPRIKGGGGVPVVSVVGVTGVGVE